RRPLILVFIALASGIIFGSYFCISLDSLLTASIICLLVILLGIRKQFIIASLCFILIFVFFTGAFNIKRHTYFPERDGDILQYIDRGKVILEGVVVEPPVYYPEKNVLLVKCYRTMKDSAYAQVSGIVRLSVPPDIIFNYGDFIRFRSTLKKIRNFQNPGAFNYERFMGLQGIYVSGYVQNSSEIILLRNNGGGRIKTKLESFRSSFRKIIHDHSSSPQKEIIEAMTLGNKSAIPSEIREAFGRTGTSHILAISGLHIGMVAAFSFFLFFLIFKRSEYLMLKFNIVKSAASFAFIFVLLYALIAGMGVTVTRATIMAFVFLMALLLSKQKEFYSTLALAGLIILIISPQSLFDVSFQLSFMSVLAIIYIIPRFNILMPKTISFFPEWMHGFVRYIYTMITVCVAATIGTMPLIMYYFDLVSFVTIAANLIAVPILGTLTLALLMLAILSALLSATLSGYFIQLSSFFVQFSIDAIQKISAIPWSSMSVTKPNMVEILFFYFLIFLFFQYFERKKIKNINGTSSSLRLAVIKSLMMICVLFFFADITYLSLKSKYSSDLRLTVIDVGQGSSTLLQFPGGSNMLIDGGGFAQSSFDVGKSVITPFLHHRRLSRIDTVVLSHPHPDHLLGLIHILNHFKVREIWQPAIPVDPEVYPGWHHAIRKNNIKVSLISDTSTKQIFKDVRVDILWPPANHITDEKIFTQDEVNDLSLVLKMTYGKISVLIPGDISANIENKLIQTKADLKNDILIVPHHGSRLSSSPEFIKAVACRYAVVSAGKANVFHHPHPSVLERYQEAGAEIYRTDNNGAVTFTTDGFLIRIDTFVKK
ncbi:MAG: DNA internalization-related competence protein ComEC/Rec2, partial [Smithella sp.]|nr:DNA internalization-related competence protein ComEC/Rec2 [Smithella sp.]